jgi:uroporphyrinogen-III synthase
MPPVVVCIGPTSAAAAKTAGLTVTAVAPAPTLDGLVAALMGAFGTTPPPDH